MDRFPDIEQQPLLRQQQFQSEQLKVLLRYLQARSPYYQKLWKEQDIAIDRIQSIEDLIYLPTTSKEDLQANGTDFLCVPRESIREYTATSGTLGSPVTIGLTASDLQRLAYNEQLSFQSMGIGKGDVVQLMLTLDRQFMAGIAYYNGLQNVGATAIRTGPGLPNMQWDVMDRLGTNALVAVPSFLLRLLDERPEKFRTAPPAIRKILAIGESLSSPDLTPNALRQNISRQWDVALFNTYAATEMQTAFTECGQHRGLHHHPELLIVEILDETGLPVTPGSPGEVTITTLGVEGMPLLRYRTGDICCLYSDPCPCGRNTVRLGPVLTRKKQMIKYKGTTLFPTAVTEILTAIPQIIEYALVIGRDEQEQDELTVFLHTAAPEKPLLEEVQAACRHRLRVTPQVKFLNAAGIRELLFSDNSRKPQRIQDNRP